jgi:hypothetical protein
MKYFLEIKKWQKYFDCISIGKQCRYPTPLRERERESTSNSSNRMHMAVTAENC